MFTFAAADTYKISHLKKNEKHSVDYKVLVRLYQPIIGCVATNLYLTLESEVSLNKYSRVYLTIARLHKLLQISEKEFNEATEVLKKYGLISYKANQRKANDYLFVINPTKSAVEFLNDDKLNKALQVVVDEIYYKQVKDYFISSIINEDEYVDIEDIKITKNITENEFYDQFFEKYPVIALSNPIDEKAKKEISRLKRLFKLEYSEVENAILNSFDYVDNQMVVDLNKLNNFIQSKYSNKEDNADEKIAKTFESERSIAYYQKLCGREVLLPRETSMINDLLDEYKISEGVLNVVINFYFRYGKNTMGISKNYFVKVIEEMLINNVKTTVDAMNYFRNRNKKIKDYKERKVVKEDNTVEQVTTPLQTIDEENNTLEEFRKLLGG